MTGELDAIDPNTEVLDELLSAAELQSQEWRTPSDADGALLESLIDSTLEQSKLGAKADAPVGGRFWAIVILSVVALVSVAFALL